MSEPLPIAVVSILARYAQRFPVPQMSGSGPSDEAFENQCRAWCLALAEQVRFETGDPRWGVKTAGGGRPQSKDSLTFNGSRLTNYDLLSGVGTGHPTLVGNPSGEDITGQVFILVTPTDHLGSPAPQEPPPSQPPPTGVNLAAVFAKLEQMDATQQAAQALTVAAMDRLGALLAAQKPPASVVVFPDYSGKLPYLGSITLKPVVKP